MSQQIALTRFIPTVNLSTNEIRACPQGFTCCRQLDSRGWGSSYNETHYWGYPLSPDGPGKYINITAGVLVRLNETASGYIPDCGTGGDVSVAFLPYEANSAGGRGRKLGLGFAILSIGMAVLVNM